MFKVLKTYQILVYYDLPELILAKDSIGTRYICLLVEIENKPTYVALAISKNRLVGFINGKIDLRSLFVEPELNEFYLITDINSEILHAKYYSTDKLPENFLPDEGYYYSEEVINDDIIKSEVVAKENAVIHLGFSDAENSGSIEAEDLGDFIKLYQHLLNHTYKKTIAEKKLKNRKSYLIPKNHVVRAFASSINSFNIHLYSVSNKDLFGNCFVEVALEKLDEIMAEPTNEQEFISVLRTIKGHGVTTYKNLLKKIISENITMKYKWYAPNQQIVHTNKITKEYAQKIYTILNETEELVEEIKEFIGHVEKADVTNGDWKIRNDNDGKEYSGVSTGNLLDGIIMNTAKYKFICQEVIEEFKVTEKEKVRYILKSIQLYK